MRRLGAALALAGALAAAIALSAGPGAVADSTYRVDAIFDTAKGIIPGQLVKIAGARVGTIDDVVLTPDYKARIQMSMDRRFGPFTEDARCEIQPEGLISENFVQCEPGDGAPLQGEEGQVPTVPLDRTSVPVSFTDLFEIWQTPVRNRFSIVINTLGAGLAARGEDLNEILRRANPTLALTRRAVDILNEQRREVADVVIATDKLVGELARRPERVTEFIDRAARVTTRIAEHRGELSEAIRRLPPLLAAARPALGRLDELVEAGTPLLSDLRHAAPGLNRLIGDLAPFAAAARPALRSLGSTAVVGRRTIKSAGPVVKLLRTFSSDLRPLGPPTAALLTNLRDRGAVENILNFVYYAAAATSRYDQTAHILPAHGVGTNCSNYAETPDPACSANYGTTAARKQAAKRKTESAPQRAQEPAAPAPQAPAAEEPEPEAGPQTLPETLDEVVETLEQVLGGVTEELPLPEKLPSGKPSSGDPILDDLIDFLLR